MSEEVKKLKIVYVHEKGTAWKCVVGNNDKFQGTSQQPIPDLGRSLHPSRTCITKCDAGGKTLEGVEPIMAPSSHS